MIWKVQILSRNTGEGWTHLNTNNSLEIRVALRRNTVRIYLKFFRCRETVETVKISNSTVEIQQKYSSLGIFTNNRKIQLKFASEQETLTLLNKIVYAQLMYTLRRGLHAITRKHKNPGTYQTKL
ncbi:hypothetical protein NEPAR06_0187 [Nematocida parisii]|uniref:Uncharacterized protein n=1 Tax=Nematocida parisii (strain ERTm3) TaxID=935791 RepID=I3EDE6_NEMP3|nr:uncharacterized protein NEPG_00583 [Nematocida parisii ERTm1]EIJ87243.1 hypothetical protein NEQG_02578 [Nematocida parisii ERTm3]KAI5126626.1 hypothetical protein NEPAR08_0545 [Nematocida parisii]EIJ95058.1 hypothetical protein NEPG_00583 [Nematocida parisii ERTm1]KAI5127909.1 hypothetical protein NEPAR03_1189 [Nematocida parisii]KAI5142847.1 hypothetical protein NEPAR04_1667 [Nematocida parisii]|eukprot:XP_013058414.1 hypothetical protein NEPG_00583 [Nematocida parisii ERTm1]